MVFEARRLRLIPWEVGTAFILAATAIALATIAVACASASPTPEMTAVTTSALSVSCSGLDDTANVQRCIDGSSASAPCALQGTCVVSVDGEAPYSDNSTIHYALSARNGMALTGSPTAAAMIQLKAGETSRVQADGGLPNYAILFSNERLSNVSISNITFDMNAANDPAPNATTAAILFWGYASNMPGDGGSPTVYAGCDGLSITGCTFENAPGNNVVVLAQEPDSVVVPCSNCLPSGATISSNVFQGNGAQAADHSSLNAVADNVQVTGNVFLGNSNYYGYVAAEIHGSNSTFSDNVVTGYYQALWVVNNWRSAAVGRTVSGNQLTVHGVGVGVSRFVAADGGLSPPVGDVSITGNTVGFTDVDVRASMQDKVAVLVYPHEPEAGPVQGPVTIHGNFVDGSGAGEWLTYGVEVISAPANAGATGTVTVDDNYAVGVTHGILASGSGLLAAITATNNVFNGLRSGSSIAGGNPQPEGVTTQLGTQGSLGNLTVTNNYFFQSSPVAMYAVNGSAGPPQAASLDCNYYENLSRAVQTGVNLSGQVNLPGMSVSSNETGKAVGRRFGQVGPHVMYSASCAMPFPPSFVQCMRGAPAGCNVLSAWQGLQGTAASPVGYVDAVTPDQTVMVDPWAALQYVTVGGKSSAGARASGGVVCSPLDGSAPSYANYFSDANGFASKPSYWGTLQVVDLMNNGSAYACARASQGVVCQPLGNGAVSLVSDQFTDAHGYDQRYWDSIQFAPLDGAGQPMQVCGRDVGGVRCNKINGGASSVVADYFSHANGFDAPQYGETIQLVDLNGAGGYQVCGRASQGIVCQPINGTAQVVASYFTDLAGFGSSPSYWGTVQFANAQFVSGGYSGMHVCARAPGGSTGGVWCQPTNGAAAYQVAPYFSDSNGFGFGPWYWGTMQVVSLSGTGLSSICMRNSNGTDCSTGGIVTAVDSGYFADTLSGVYQSASYWGPMTFVDPSGAGPKSLCARTSNGLLCHTVIGGSPFGGAYPTFADTNGFRGIGSD